MDCGTLTDRMVMAWLEDVSLLTAPTSVVSIDHSLAGDIRVLFTSLQVPDEKLKYLQGLLSEEELGRAGRFRTFDLQRNFIVTHGNLRQLLGMSINTHPRSVAIRYDAYHKPYVDFSGERGNLRFNLSHSGHYALYAFTWNREIGVDLEYIDEQRASEAISRRYFTANEIRDLESLPEAERTAAFFSCWVRKEAYIKAVGEGLTIPLDSFEVTVRPDQDAAITAHFQKPSEVQRWQLIDLSDALPVCGFKAALAVERSR